MVRRPTDTIGEYGLMPTKDGWFAFWYVPVPDGKPKRKRARLGIPRSTPRVKAKAAFALWVRSRSASLAQDQKLTVGQIMDLYIDDRRREGKNHHKMKHQWVPLKPMFENLQPADLAAPFMVEGEQRTRCHLYAVKRAKAGMARDTIHSELNLLRSAMSWAFKRGILGRPVFVWVSSAGKPRRTALTEDELMALLGAIVEAEEHIRLLMLIAMATGARKQAILDLVWKRVDFDRRLIDFNTGVEKSILDTSHQKGRAIVDMSDGLHDALKRAKEYATCGHVIEYRGRPVKDPKDGVRAVFRKAGLGGKYLGLHALRHTLATAAAAHGIDMRKIQMMLGHDDIDTTERVYAEFRQGYLSDVARLADPHIKALNAVKSQEKSQA